MNHIRKMISKVMKGLTNHTSAILPIIVILMFQAGTADVYAVPYTATNASTGDIAFLTWIAILIGALIAALITRRKSKDKQGN